MEATARATGAVANDDEKSSRQRLGHLSESGMRILYSKNALPGMKNIQLDFCEGCVYGKKKWVSFRRDGKEKKTERLELVHTDVCRPTTVKSLGDNFYFVSFIDDASRKTWIYAIKEKSEVYHTFKKWKALVENETGNKIKCLKSDNGGEYRDGGFQEFCSNNGIRLIVTVKRTPQENGLVERMNGTIMERARCIAYAHIDKEDRKKLDSKSQKCVFIRYGGDEYGYRLWDYEHNKIIRSKDVIFDESRLYKHRLQEHGIKKENKEYTELDEPEDGQIPKTENSEVLDEITDTEIGTGDQQQVPETLNLRRSSRDLGEAKQLLGMRITRDRKQKKLWLSQEEYIIRSKQGNNLASKIVNRARYGQVDCKLWTDSQSAIHLGKNLAFHSRTKHIQLRYHFIRSLLEDGQLNLEKIEGNKNPADMLTKVVDRQKLSLCSTLISLR
ncbi:hypothetical protein RJ639_033354 [Escallonia herrerae]|uniref:Integrase catalytic domain-containing protein n=1 Tax=Escallonia herrerae TaxID=1293975 RepID=A0AA88WVT9_9ASTE|nr:hypothetical protein RJ639_033354 [Escallonia herrerae]